MQDFGIFIISNRLGMAERVKQSVLPFSATIFDGNGYESFAKLFNTCVAQSPFELNIIIGDKAIATSDTIDFILNKLNEGYALVAACGFACVGFRKDLFVKIGPLDERFTGGSFEDSDYITRLKEANLALHYSWECEHLKSASSWANFEENKQKYIEKWGGQHISNATRLIPELQNNYNFTDSPREYLDSTRTII